MYLLKAILPYYIRTIEAYIKNKKNRSIFIAIMPNETHLANAKQDLAMQFLSVLHRLNLEDSSPVVQEEHSVDDVSACSMAINFDNCTQLSEYEIAAGAGDSVEVESILDSQLPVDSPIGSSYSSYKRKHFLYDLKSTTAADKSDNELHREENDGVVTVGGINSPIDMYSILVLTIDFQIEACAKARREHRDHKPGSYELILETMQDNLLVIRHRSEQMNYGYIKNHYTPKSDLKIFNATYRNNLYRSIYVLLCMLAFDSVLCRSDLLSKEQKTTYALGCIDAILKRAASVSKVGSNLLVIADHIFASGYEDENQFRKALADYTITLLNIQAIYDKNSEFCSRLKEFRSDLLENYIAQYPNSMQQHSVDQQVENFIRKENLMRELYILPDKVNMQISLQPSESAARPNFSRM